MKLEQLQSPLDCIEKREFELISWGDIEVSSSEDELIELFEREFPDYDADDLFEALLDSALIVGYEDIQYSDTRYRSRMANAINLFCKLRQWMHGQKLEASKSLVSDYRFIRRARLFPKRDTAPHILCEQIYEEGITNPIVSDVINALANGYQLSGFQVRATIRILTEFEKHQRRRKYPSATITCAGTGSGKTMAFYLPAITSLVSQLQSDSSFKTRVLAIYPRKELLKDQFNETWSACRKLDSLALRKFKRKIRIGALFSDVPSSPHSAVKDKFKHGKDYLPISFISCSSDKCIGQMQWHKQDALKGIEKVSCSICNASISEDEIALTRSSIEKNPPDILFTTTEMMNQNIANPKRGHLFGIGTSHIPLVLLDETHTYNGVQGAQVSLLLKRWMKLAKNAPHFMGLSATLADAKHFFSKLTGTQDNNTLLIEPIENELEEYGAEYLLTLKGDPVSQAALLSTTIQAAMLTRRILDKKNESKGVFGNKTFLFTDDLDVNNRLMAQLSDAEGYWLKNGKLVDNTNGPLAALRNPVFQDQVSPILMQEYGQNWSTLKENGFSLDFNDKAIVSRTSSLDAGVDVNSDMIVATASLEVGFNDPEVGAVIQHKAPRDLSSFIQRKGRAGRTRDMRPWTIVVLSEFGKDRLTFQQYEGLVNPEVKLQGLPIENIHILKMQGALATLEWIGCSIKQSPWVLLNYPQNISNDIRKKLVSIIDEVLVPQSPMQQELSIYIESALKLEGKNDLTNKILWESPRSIFLEVLPSLKRLIITKWAGWNYQDGLPEEWMLANKKWNSPLPRFIPSNLFADLNVPSLDITLLRNQGDIQMESMGFFQGLKEFSPGRVSKRFSIKSGMAADCLIPQNLLISEELDGTQVNFELPEAFGNSLNQVAAFSHEGNEELKVFKPFQIYPQALFNSKDISDTSNSFLKWNSKFEIEREGIEHAIPNHSEWEGILEKLDFYTHDAICPLRVIRYSTGAKAEFKLKKGKKTANVEFLWTLRDEPVSIGTDLMVDAIRFRFKVNELKISELVREVDTLKALRVQYFQYLLRTSNVCSGNIFLSDWVFDCVIAAIGAESSLNNTTIKESIKNVISGKSEFSISDIPPVLFKQDVELEEDNGEQPDKQLQKLQKQILEKIEEVSFLSSITELSKVLYSDLDSDQDFIDWSRIVLANSFAAGVLNSTYGLLPDIEERSITADYELGEEYIDVWLTEQNSGGTGVISALQDLYTSDTHKYLNMLSSSFNAGDYEKIDNDISSILSSFEQGSELKKVFSTIRNTIDYQDKLTALKELRNSCIRAGYLYSQSFSNILFTRVLRAGSSIGTDRKLANYLNDWMKIERSLGIEVPLNIASFILACKERGSSPNKSLFESTCNIQSVLWTKGFSVRQTALSFYSPFQNDIRNTERLLVSNLLTNRFDYIEYTDDKWHVKLHEKLVAHGRVNLLIPKEFIEQLHTIIATIHICPVDTNGLLFYPRIKSVNYETTNIVLTTELAEAVV